MYIYMYINMYIHIHVRLKRAPRYAGWEAKKVVMKRSPPSINLV